MTMLIMFLWRRHDHILKWTIKMLKCKKNGVCVLVNGNLMMTSCVLTALREDVPSWSRISAGISKSKVRTNKTIPSKCDSTTCENASISQTAKLFCDQPSVKPDKHHRSTVTIIPHDHHLLVWNKVIRIITHCPGQPDLIQTNIWSLGESVLRRLKGLLLLGGKMPKWQRRQSGRV